MADMTALTDRPKRAALYARHSTDKQATSTTDQINRCRAYCKARGYQITGIYKDEAVSGKVQKRTGMIRLMAAARKDEMDVIVTEDLSRLSRRMAQISDTYDILSFLGITIETVSNGSVSQVDVGLRGTMNALYLTDLADKTRRGMKAAVQRGSLPGGRTYGYRATPKLTDSGETIRGLRTIVPEEAAIIRQIFADYLTGTSLKRLAEDLNARGIPSPGGGKWYATTLVGTASRGSGILRNRLYIGEVVFNRQEWKSHPETGHRLSAVRSEEEWITTDVPEMAILPKKLFDDVQEELERRSSVRRDLKEERRKAGEERKQQDARDRQRRHRLRQERTLTNAMLFFSGRLYCGSSGQKMKSLRKEQYGCRTENCHQCPRTLDTFLDAALSAITDLKPADILVAYDAGDIKAKREAYQASVVSIETQEAEARQNMTRVLDILGSSTRREEIRAFLQANEDSIRRLNAQRTTAVRELRLLSPTEKTIEQAVALLGIYADRLEADLMDHQPNKRLRECINRVTVLPGGRVEIDWNMLGVMHLLRIEH
ncbi:recombinase family protein [Novispirillum itersonii]|uniref:recombinase family protein n=1 Tax=Novispirillum itersonii TaxID=189 RepID=UPI00035E1CBB|nr:recombinase family protein [Novispirillum itersonii]